MKPLPTSIQERLHHGGQDLTVLVVRLGAMGDVLRAAPAVRALRRSLPEATIAWAVDDRWSVVVRWLDDVDTIVELPRRSIAPKRDRLRRIAGFRSSLAALGTDLCIDLHGNLRSGVVSRWSRATVRLGYEGHQQKEGNRWFLSHRLPSGARRVSRVERNLALVEAIGVSVRPFPLPRVAVGTSPPSRFDRWRGRRLPPGRPVVILMPGASAAQAYKRPPVDLLATAARAASAHGAVPVVLFGPGERPDAEHVVRESRGEAVLGPPTSLSELAEALRAAALFVGGDTGPMHLACAVGCPVAALYGPTDPAVNAPWGVPHVALAPVDRVYTGIKRLDRRHGFEGLTAAAVERGVSELLDAADTRDDVRNH